MKRYWLRHALILIFFCSAAFPGQVWSQNTPSPQGPAPSPQAPVPSAPAAPSPAPAPAAAVDDVCGEVPCDVTVISDQQPFRNVRILSLTEQTIRLGAAHYRAEGLTLDRSTVQKIVFNGGDEGAKGIVLKNGLNFNGTVSRFINGIFTIHMDGIPGSQLSLRLGDVLSINFREPAMVPSSGGSQGSWKYLTSKNILEWTYANSETSVMEEAKFTLNIEKIAIASNQIVLTAKAFDKAFGYKHCGIACTLEDDLRTEYKEVVTPVGTIANSKGRAVSFTFKGPSPSPDAQFITIKIRPVVIKGDKWKCGNFQKWSVLPQFSMDMLK